MECEQVLSRIRRKQLRLVIQRNIQRKYLEAIHGPAQTLAMPHRDENETLVVPNSVKLLAQDDVSEENSSDGNGNQVNKILFTEKVQHAIEQVGRCKKPCYL